MAKLHLCAAVSMGITALAVLSFFAGPAGGAECKRKRAGFFLLDTNDEAPRKLILSLESMPASLTGAFGDPVRGRRLLADTQKSACLSCHKLGAIASVSEQGNIGPALDGVGGRLSKAQLRQVVVDPKAYYPDTIMPSYHKPGANADASILTAAEVEDLLSYLETLK